VERVPFLWLLEHTLAVEPTLQQPDIQVSQFFIIIIIIIIISWKALALCELAI
jgi:hypothetical protein